MFHSDRGSQYASHRYTELLAEHGIRASMSGKGNCWDNACSEILFGSLKVERLHGRTFHSHRDAKDATLDWLLWYNGSSSKPTLEHTPSQPDREGST
ncbi:MAG: DDE-type integrase/transposase/recombinase [Acidobacteriaceae bacterium]